MKVKPLPDPTATATHPKRNLPEGMNEGMQVLCGERQAFVDGEGMKKARVMLKNESKSTSTIARNQGRENDGWQRKRGLLFQGIEMAEIVGNGWFSEQPCCSALIGTAHTLVNRVAIAAMAAWQARHKRGREVGCARPLHVEFQRIIFCIVQ